jgi:aspartate racemase
VAKAIKRVRAANFAAANSYVPSVYPGRATFFWARDSFITCTLKFRVAWDLLVPRGLEMHIIPGSHVGMFEEPYVQVLAGKIKECLEKERLYQARKNQNSSELKQSEGV